MQNPPTYTFSPQLSTFIYRGFSHSNLHFWWILVDFPGIIQGFSYQHIHFEWWFGDVPNSGFAPWSKPFRGIGRPWCSAARRNSGTQNRGFFGLKKGAIDSQKKGDIDGKLMGILWEFMGIAGNLLNLLPDFMVIWMGKMIGFDGEHCTFHGETDGWW